MCSLGNIEAKKEILPAAGETSAYPRRPEPGTAIISDPGGHGPGLRAVRAGKAAGRPPKGGRHWWVAGGAATGFLGY